MQIIYFIIWGFSKILEKGGWIGLIILLLMLAMLGAQ